MMEPMTQYLDMWKKWYAAGPTGGGNGVPPPGAPPPPGFQPLDNAPGRHQVTLNSNPNPKP